MVPTLHSSDKHHLVIMHYTFSISLDSFLNIFIRSFVNIFLREMDVNVLFSNIFVSVCYQGNAAPIKCFVKCTSEAIGPWSLFSLFKNNFKKE